MSEYLKRIKSGCKTWELCVWWVFRALMIFALVQSFFVKPFVVATPLQLTANLVAMFAWEIFQLFPKKSFVRYMPSLVQDVSTIMIFAASFGGQYMNFYYDVAWWDSALHLISGALCTLLGYEVAVCMQKRDKKTSSVSIVILCAIGFSFFVSTCWELFEFTADQIMSNPETGAIGDAQHWCYELAQGTPKAATLFDPKYPERWPIMDTMGDIVLNSIGAVAAWILLKIYPYRHKGKDDTNKQIEAELAAQKETADIK